MRTGMGQSSILTTMSLSLMSLCSPKIRWLWLWLSLSRRWCAREANQQAAALPPSELSLRLDLTLS